MMKKFVIIPIIIISLFQFSGCFSFGSDEENNEQSGSNESSSIYKSNDFNIEIPNDWEVIDKNDFTSEVPPETVVVFRNNVKNENFTANVNIVKRDLQKSMSNMEFANQAINREKSGLIDYKETEKDEIAINIGESEIKTYLIQFEARKTTNDNLVRYYQTFGVVGDSGYIITGSFSKNEKENIVQLVENIVKSIRLN